jgi:hypothetical protein
MPDMFDVVEEKPSFSLHIATAPLGIGFLTRRHCRAMPQAPLRVHAQIETGTSRSERSGHVRGAALDRRR